MKDDMVKAVSGQQTAKTWVPTVEEETSGGIREVLLQTRHFTDRKIFLTGEITDETAVSFVSEMLYLQEKEEPVQIYINSPGGSVTAGLVICDVLNRMKHNHTSWSIRGGNHLAKLLAKKCSGRLEEVTEKFKKELFEEQVAAELIGEIIHPGSVPKFTGKGYEYPDRGHFPALSYKLQGNNKQLFGVVDM